MDKGFALFTPLRSDLRSNALGVLIRFAFFDVYS